MVMIIEVATQYSSLAVPQVYAKVQATILILHTLVNEAPAKSAVDPKS